MTLLIEATCAVLLATILVPLSAGADQAPRRSNRRVMPICPRPSVPAPDDSGLILGAAGAPMSLFGDPAEPNFADVFAQLGEVGFDLFFPFFGVFEDDGGAVVTAHMEHFLPPELFPAGHPIEATCAAGANPYTDADGRLRIVFPAYLLAPGHDPETPLDEDQVRGLLNALLERCVGDATAVIGGWQVFDEPVNAAVAAAFEDPPRIHDLSNPARLASVVRERRNEPVLLIEAALPFWLDYDPELANLPDDLRHLILDQFNDGITATATAADWYGFDLYPVPTAADLGVVGDYAALARATAPSSRTIAVLQGFGLEDLNGAPGRRPTAEETRFMAYDAVVNGASVLFWWGQSAMEVDEDPTLWRAIIDTGSELRTLSGILAGEVVPAPVVGDGIEAAARRRYDVTWLFMVNRRASPTTAEIELTGLESGRPWAVHDALTGDVLAYGIAHGTTAIVPIGVSPSGVRVLSIVSC